MPQHDRHERTQVIPERLALAQHYLDDAQLLLAAARFGSAVSRAYYAAYQAMWAALDNPPRPGAQWRHGAIINHFVRGYWFLPSHPPTGPGLLEPLRFALHQLYDLRLDADYDGGPITREDAETGVHTVQRTLAEIDRRTQGEQP
jgi:hypothetical protein